MVRRVDPNGELLGWCRKCPGRARCGLETKLLSRCRPEQKDTIELTCVENILTLDEGGVSETRNDGK